MRITVAEAAEQTLARLREVGWRKGVGVGSECVAVAAVNQLGAIGASRLFVAIYRRLDGSYGNIAVWNDDPATTWEDVERMLSELAHVSH